MARSSEGRRAGSMGDAAIFSFYPGKNLGAYGEGGLVTTNNPDYDKQIRMLRNWGTEQRYYHVLKGFNYRMEGIQGAVLRVKLKYLEKWTEARRTNADLYGAAQRQRRRHADRATGSPACLPRVRDSHGEPQGVSGAFHGGADSVRHPLSAADSPDAGSRGPRLPGGRLPSVSEATCEKVFSLPLVPDARQMKEEKAVLTAAASQAAFSGGQSAHCSQRGCPYAI